MWAQAHENRRRSRKNPCEKSRYGSSFSRVAATSQPPAVVLQGAAAACESALRSLARGIMETVKTGKEAINSVSPVLVSAWPHILAALT